MVPLASLPPVLVYDLLPCRIHDAPHGPGLSVQLSVTSWLSFLRRAQHAQHTVVHGNISVRQGSDSVLRMAQGAQHTAVPVNLTFVPESDSVSSHLLFASAPYSSELRISHRFPRLTYPRRTLFFTPDNTLVSMNQDSRNDNGGSVRRSPLRYTLSVLPPYQPDNAPEFIGDTVDHSIDLVIPYPNEALETLQATSHDIMGFCSFSRNFLIQFSLLPNDPILFDTVFAITELAELPKT